MHCHFKITLNPKHISEKLKTKKPKIRTEHEKPEHRKRNIVLLKKISRKCRFL